MEKRTVKFLKDYLEALEITDYKLDESQDTLGYLLILTMKNTDPKIGVLKGKSGKNIDSLKKLLRVVGFGERINPNLVVKIQG